MSQLVIEINRLTTVIQTLSVAGRRESEEEIDGVCAIDTIPDEVR